MTSVLHSKETFANTREEIIRNTVAGNGESPNISIFLKIRRVLNYTSINGNNICILNVRIRVNCRTLCCWLLVQQWVSDLYYVYIIIALLVKGSRIKSNTRFEIKSMTGIWTKKIYQIWKSFHDGLHRNSRCFKSIEKLSSRLCILICNCQ